MSDEIKPKVKPKGGWMSGFDPKKWLDGYAPGLVKEYVSGLEAALAASQAENKRLEIRAKAAERDLDDLRIEAREKIEKSRHDLARYQREIDGGE